MRRHLVPAVLAATALAATGGAAIAIAGSVSTSPAPLYISRTSRDGVADHPDTRPAAVRTATSTTAVTSTTVPERPSTTVSTTAASTTAASTPITAPRSSTTVTSIDDHGGDRADDNRGHGSDDSGFDDHGDDNSGHGSDDSGSDDHGGSEDGDSGDSSGHGSDD
jgi:hypothetical protein